MIHSTNMRIVWSKPALILKIPWLLTTNFFSDSSLSLIKWNDLYVVDQNVRRWSNNVIRAKIFNSLINNSSLKPIEQHILDGRIDWVIIKQWMNHNPLTRLPAKLCLKNRDRR